MDYSNGKFRAKFGIKFNLINYARNFYRRKQEQKAIENESKKASDSYYDNTIEFYR